MLLRSVLRDIVYMITRIAEVAHLVHEMKMIDLESLNLSEREMNNHKKLHEIQMNNLKRDFVNSIIRNFPNNFDNLVEFDNWDNMEQWINKQLKINKEAK